MLKKITLGVLMLAVAWLFFLVPLQADMGPKPTADLFIEGASVPYEIDILVPFPSGSIDEVSEEETSYVFERIRYDHYLEDDYFDTVFPVLNGYQDVDGYASMTIYKSMPTTIRQEAAHHFYLGYFRAPSDFKVAIITEDGELIVSEAMNRRQFTATFHYDLTGVDMTSSQQGVGLLSETVPTADIMQAFFVRLALTLLAELAVLFVFFYRKLSSYMFVGAVNLFTQTGITLLTIVGYYFWGGMLGALLLFVLAELVVFLTEMILYALFLKEKSRLRAVLYAITANTVSLLIGFILLLSLG